MKDNGSISRRLFLLLGLLIVFMVIPIVWNLIKLQFVDGAEWRSKAKSSTIKLRDVKAQRGTIYSADGKMLATSLPVYDIYIDFGREKVEKSKKYDDSAKVDGKWVYYKNLISKETFNDYLSVLCDSMSRLFPEKSYDEYYNYFSNAQRQKNRYCCVKKGVTYYQRQRMMAFPILMEDTLPHRKKQSVPFKPSFCRAIIMDTRDIRVHPYGNMARHTIGFQVNQGDGFTYNGLEGYYDKYLRGQQGQRLERFLARINGKSIWAPVENSDQKRAVDGLDIVSTIDSRLQDLATNSLYKCVSEN